MAADRCWEYGKCDIRAIDFASGFLHNSHMKIQHFALARSPFTFLTSILCALLVLPLYVADAAAAGPLMRVEPDSISLPRGVTFSEGVTVKMVDNTGHDLAGTSVKVILPAGCGSFSGASTIERVTDNQGYFFIPSFTSASTSRTCALDVQFNGVRVSQVFSVFTYAPSEVVVSSIPPSPVVAYGGEELALLLSFKRADGTLLPNLPLSWDVPNNEPNRRMDLMRIQDRQDGNVSLVAKPYRNAGTVPLLAKFGGTSRAIDVTVAERPPRRSASSLSKTGTGRVKLSIVSANESCSLSAGFGSLLGNFDQPGTSLPVPMTFIHGYVLFQTENCTPGAPVTFSLEWPDAVPSDADLWMSGNLVGGSPATSYFKVPATVSGRVTTFAITDGGAGDGDLKVDGKLQVGMTGLAVRYESASAKGVSVNRQDMYWAGSAENGWGMSLVQHNDTSFSVIYAYDSNGAPTWYVMPGGKWDAAKAKYDGNVYTPRGSPYFAYDASRFVPGAAAGTMSINTGTPSFPIIDYTLNGVSARKYLRRQVFKTSIGTYGIPDRGDMWWGGTTQDGWGMAILQQLDGLFCVWFTYDANGDRTWFVMPSGYWLTSDTYEGALYRTRGSPWLGTNYDPASLVATIAGQYRLRFLDENNAEFYYSLDGKAGTLKLSRQPF